MSATVVGVARPDDSDDGPARTTVSPRKITARVPLVVWLVVAVQAVLLVSYSLLLPAFRAPDEVTHVDLVLRVAATRSYPQYDGELVDPGVEAARTIMKTDRRSANLLATEAIPRDRRPSFADIRATTSGVARLPNQMPQHPPLYYVMSAAAFGGVRAVVPGNLFDAFDRQVALLRLISALMILPLPLIAWLVARRIGLGTAPSLAAAIVPLANPQLTHLGASVNNDDLFILLGALLTLVLAHIATGDVRTRTIAVAGALCGAALFTKAFAALFPIWIVAAVAIGRARRRERVRARDVVVVGATTLLFGGWWWVRNVVVFGELSPSIETEGRLAAPRRPGFTPDWVRWGRLAFRNIGKTFFGDFGWYEVWIPVGVMIAAWIVLGVAVGLACFGPRRNAYRRLPARAVSLLLFAPFLLTGGFVLANAARLYRQSGQPVLLQGRYLFSGLVGLSVLVGVAAATVGVRFPRAERSAPLAMLFLAAVMQFLGIKTVLDRYWGALDASVRERIGALVAWSPWPAPWLWLGAVVGVAFIGALVVRIALLTRDELVAR